MKSNKCSICLTSLILGLCLAISPTQANSSKDICTEDHPSSLKPRFTLAGLAESESFEPGLLEPISSEADNPDSLTSEPVAVKMAKPETSYDEKTAKILLGIDNFAMVTPQIWRGANPSDKDIATLKNLGVKSIINLRMPGKSAKHEQQISSKYGIKYFHIPFGYLKASNMKLGKVLTLMTTAENQPVYIHCMQGADRTGMVVGLYRTLFQNWSFKRTYAEMRAFHFKPWFGNFRNKVRLCWQDKPLILARENILHNDPTAPTAQIDNEKVLNQYLSSKRTL